MQEEGSESAPTCPLPTELRKPIPSEDCNGWRPLRELCLSSGADITKAHAVLSGPELTNTSLYRALHANFDGPWVPNSPVKLGSREQSINIPIYRPSTILEFDGDVLWPIDGEEEEAASWPFDGVGELHATHIAASRESSNVVGWIPKDECSELHDDIFTKHVEDAFLTPHQNAGSSLPNAVLRDPSSSRAGTSQPALNTKLASLAPPMSPPPATLALSLGGSTREHTHAGGNLWAQRYYGECLVLRP
jgi:hypothetical protein